MSMLCTNLNVLPAVKSELQFTIYLNLLFSIYFSCFLFNYINTVVILKILYSVIFRFTTKKEFKLHEIIHNDTDMPPFKCQACNKQIDTLEGCKEHVDTHSVSIYFCPICNENISSRSNATDHLKKHFGDIIDESSDMQIDFEKDENYIKQLGGILCKFCPLVYKDRVEFDAHFSCEHGNEDIVYTCNVCGKEYQKYSVFSDHSYNHVMKDRFW